MEKRTRMIVAVALAVLMALITGCGLLSPFQTDAKPKMSKWDRMAREKNESMDLKKLKLEPYAEKVGGELTSPEYEKFASNTRVRVAGSAEDYRDFRAKVAWIEVEKIDGPDSSDEDRFSYYAPLKQGKFDQTIRLFAGKGEYRVTVRLPSTKEKDRFYDLAQFEVTNVNPNWKRDISRTRIGREMDVKISRPVSGLTEAKGAFQLKGSLGKQPNHKVMIRLEKDGEQWEHLISTKNGRFSAQIPLFYGKGIHKLTVLVPDTDRENYFNEAASLWVKNRSEEKRNPIEYFKHYEKRGVKLEQPLSGGGSGNMKYRIKGRIDPDAPFAEETENLIVQTKKDGEEATYFIPVENYRFDDTFWLRFGPGEYEVTVNVPEITDERRDYFRFFGVARFTVRNTAEKDLRNLLPSRGIQSDSDQIEKLARKLTRGKEGEREKALAIYQYVAKNVRYDVQKFKNDTFEYDDSALKTLREKEGVCQDYSFLTIALLRSIGIETRFVEGYADGNRHAWVEVKVGGQWLTMDPTWGAGYIDENDRFIRKYSTKYFDPDPAEFQKTHRRTGVMY
ncbi:transglutaminase domain-containing protein [Paludifilum halophilum]|uniref:transglutaminase domain-containing protein n=1 Tax=Paludifilum halophilum TaxID=1642702 RepID=UPI00146AA179|nr:transglutaminase-like domain-containing protein [Paludifilum halophilum]